MSPSCSRWCWNTRTSTRRGTVHLDAGLYNFAPMLEDDYKKLAEHETYPRWALAMFRALASDERTAKSPAQAIAHFAYNDLLHDAVLFAFKRIETMTGEALGSEEEMEEYAQRILTLLKAKDDDKMDFSHAYMPLVLGGLTIYDQVLLRNHNNVEILQETRLLLDERMDEQTDDNEPIFDLSRRIIELALQKYGYIDR